MLGGLEWMEGEVPTPHGNIKVSCSKTRIKVQGVAGAGVLRFKSTIQPTCAEGILRLRGANEYELTIDANKEYTVTYAAEE
jgi:hypothetical protein